MGGLKFTIQSLLRPPTNGAFLKRNGTNKKRILAVISTTEKKKKKGLILSQILGACLVAPLWDLHRLSCHQKLQVFSLSGKVACLA